MTSSDSFENRLKTSSTRCDKHREKRCDKKNTQKLVADTKIGLNSYSTYKKIIYLFIYTLRVYSSYFFYGKNLIHIVRHKILLLQMLIILYILLILNI